LAGSPYFFASFNDLIACTSLAKISCSALVEAFQHSKATTCLRPYWTSLFVQFYSGELISSICQGQCSAMGTHWLLSHFWWWSACHNLSRHSWRFSLARILVGQTVLNQIHHELICTEDTSKYRSSPCETNTQRTWYCWCRDQHWTWRLQQ
jgi:hypothetical protein